MSNQQLYITVGIPFFSILFVWIASAMLNRSAIMALRNEMKANTDALRSEIKTTTDALRSEMKTTTDALRSEMHTGFADVHRRIDDLRSEMHTGFTDVHRRIGEQSERIGRVEGRLDAIDNDIRVRHENRLTTLEARVFERAS